MGLFGWIKKDLSAHRRRESAPPLTRNITSSSVASATRDGGYVEKLNKFNEWRTQQRLERNSEGCALEATSGGRRRIPSVIEEESDGATGGTQSDISSDVEVNSEEQRVLSRKFEVPKSPRYTRHRPDGAAPRKPKRSVEFYRNINRIPENVEHGLNNGKNSNASERYSMPAVMPSRVSKKNKTRLSKSNNNNTIYENEVEEFENLHVRDTLGDTYAVQSPPSKFYKQNSSPYLKPAVTCRAPAVVDTTPKKQVNLLQKSSRPKSFKDKPAPPPPLPTSEPPKIHNHINESASETPFTGSYRGFELNSSSIYDEHVISSRGYRGNMKSFNSSTKERCKSPSYQTIVNKHGDLVDYALPYSDSQSEQNTSKNGDLIEDIRACDQVFNENFSFLNSGLQLSTLILDDTTSIITEPISVLKKRAPKIITDLDQSLQSQPPTDLHIQEPPDDILLELDSLEQWSKSIQLSDDFLQKQITNSNLLEHFAHSSPQTLICYPREIHYRVGALRNPTLTPLEYSCGLFRTTPVTLRKYALNVERNLYFAEEGCKKDFELLAQVKHYGIASLMAVCYDPGLNQATLVLEPFDFTLFDYIHKMNKRLSLFHAITVAQQIASAVAYLQECGYIHSNISSGTVLMRRYPYAAKLTSFELATEVADGVRKEIENRYGSTSSSRNSMTLSQNEELRKIRDYARLIKNDEVFLRDKYRKLSRKVAEEGRSRSGQTTSLGDGGGYDCRGSRYLPYCKEYRERYALFYYVAPELLVPKANFVFPTVATDVYSLSLLLWEILNGYVPFVVYSRQELEKLQVSATAAGLQLPMFEKERCDHFRKVFETGLADLGGRKLTVADIVDTLDCLMLEQDSEKRTQGTGFGDDYEEQLDTSEIRKKNELNDVRKQSAMEKTDNKKYFQSGGGYVNTENLGKMGKQRPVKPARKINKPKEEETKKSPFGSSFNLSNSTLYQTIFDFNKFLSPRSAANRKVTYERTSTVKKHKKPARAGKLAAKELFEPITTLGSGTGSFHNLSDSKQDKPAAISQQVIGPLEVYCKESPAKMNINSEKAKFLKETIVDGSPYDDRTNEVPQSGSVTSKSCDSSPGIGRRKPFNSMRFTIGEITLPDTPIARKNKIRKHAWLSDQKIAEGNTSTPVTPQGRRICSFFNDLGSRRGGRSDGEFCSPLNLNISSSMQEIKPKKINISVNIIKSSDVGNQLKACSEDFSKTMPPAIVDIDIGEPAAVKAESAHNIFEDTLWKKEKELCERSKSRHSANDLDEVDTSASVITAHLTSVRDTVRKIETTFENTGFDYSPNRKIMDSAKKPEVERKISQESVVIEENLLIPTKVLELEKTIEQFAPSEPDPKPSVSRLDVVLTNNTQKKKEELLQQSQPETPLFSPNSQLFIRRKAASATSGSSVIQRTVYRESIDASSTQATSTPGGSARKTKLTTRVTVNMRKISRRASDIGTTTTASPLPSRPGSFILESGEDQPATPTTPASTATAFRHSCGNDLLKAIAAVRSSSANEMARPTSAGGIGERASLCTPVKQRGSERLVCCNCGSSMVPADSLSVPTGSRIGMSAAFSELNFPRESLPSMFDENLGFIQHMQHPPPGTPSSLRQTLMAPNARSTEDLYIDDDFCQGQLQLGANMELLVDDGHYLDEFGYDIYTEETIYDTEEDDVKLGELQNVETCGQEEQLFESKCADLNPTSIEAAIGGNCEDERK